jgi:hypothetical protein
LGIGDDFIEQFADRADNGINEGHGFSPFLFRKSH